eukprot:scaffold7198_cov122-Isochrysis_galbana.AAC.2
MLLIQEYDCLVVRGPARGGRVAACCTCKHMYMAWAGMGHGYGQCCSVCMHAVHGWEWGMWRRAASWRVCEFACGWLNLRRLQYNKRALIHTAF